MTNEHEASRRLVKSPPELWAECSDPSCLARHLGEFGEIRITRVEPETTVAWEGERASGTVRIEPSGWGTRVTLTALTEAVTDETTEAAAEVPEPGPELEGEPAEEESDATAQETLEEPVRTVAAEGGRFRMRWRRLTGRLRGAFRGLEPELDAPVEKTRVEQPEPSVEPASTPEPEPREALVLCQPEVDPEAVLVAALDSLGQAHHRPFSRA